MKFWASTECHEPAYHALRHVRVNVEAFLNRSFKSSCLNDFDVLLRYVPIVMPKELRDRYPARSKVRQRSRIYDCAPQLDYHVFVGGTFETQLTEYIIGISEASAALESFGATRQQIAKFNEILAEAKREILAERSKHH